jgi:hypothetical protein
MANWRSLETNGKIRKQTQQPSQINQHQKVATVTETESSPMALDQLRASLSDQNQVGWFLVVSGVIGAVLLIIRGGRQIMGWLVVAGMIGGGASLLLQERQERIDTATENIVAELDALDPVARAQVLAALAEGEVDRIKP